MEKEIKLHDVRIDRNQRGEQFVTATAQVIEKKRSIGATVTFKLDENVQIANAVMMLETTVRDEIAKSFDGLVPERAS